MLYYDTFGVIVEFIPRGFPKQLGQGREYYLENNIPDGAHENVVKLPILRDQKTDIIWARFYGVHGLLQTLYVRSSYLFSRDPRNVSLQNEASLHQVKERVPRPPERQRIDLGCGRR